MEFGLGFDISRLEDAEFNGVGSFTIGHCVKPLLGIKKLEAADCNGH